MSRLRMLMITVVATGMLAAMTVATTTAQEEGPPQPPPGEPFYGLMAGSASFVPLEEPTEECPFGIRTVTDSTGSTTIGEISIHWEHCATPGMPSAPAGQMTLTDESGDQISGPYYTDCGPVVPSVPTGEIVSCSGRVMFASGTGAFADVSGTAYTTNHVWFPGSLGTQDWLWILTMEGIIDY